MRKKGVKNPFEEVQELVDLSLQLMEEVKQIEKAGFEEDALAFLMSQLRRTASVVGITVIKYEQQRKHKRMATSAQAEDKSA
jgi:hypothetical protein